MKTNYLSWIISPLEIVFSTSHNQNRIIETVFPIWIWLLHQKPLDHWFGKDLENKLNELFIEGDFNLSLDFHLVSDHGHEVNTARGRLEGVLQILIERTESDTSEESDVDVTDLIHEGRRYFLHILTCFHCIVIMIICSR